MKKLTLLVCVLLLAVISVNIVAADRIPDIRINLLNQDPNPARAGDTANLRFKLQNYADTAAQKLELELVQDYPFTVVSGPSLKTFEHLDAFQTGKNYVNVEYTIKIDRDAKQGQKSLTVRYRYGDGAWASLDVPIAIDNKEFAQIIYVDKARLEPGKETDMKFTIINIGNAPLQNMIFSWAEPTGAILPVYSSDMKYVKYLDIGQSVGLTYKVIADVNAKPGLYQLTLNLKSESVATANPATISTKTGVFVGGETDFDVAFSESSQGQTSLSVANTGNNPAQSVSITIPAQESFRVGGSSSAIIGNLDKGDYTLVSFQIIQASSNFSQRRQYGQQQNVQRKMEQPVENAKTGGNDLKVVIEYTDTAGERRKANKTVPIQFRSPTEQGTTGYNRSMQQSSGVMGGTSFWILLFVVIALLLLLRKKERRAKIAGLFTK